MLSTLFLVAALAMPGAAGGYLPPGAPEAGGVRHLCLIYHGQARRPEWTRESLRPYVARVDAEGAPLEWLFDSFLFIEFATDSGRQLYYHAADRPQPDAQDWEWLADAWFRPESGLAGLERCVAETGAALGDPEHRVNVVITLPVPLREMTGFGPLPGTETPLDFSRGADRETAMRWYMDTVQGRFEQRGYRHLNLLGFYWTGESITRAEHEMVRWTADRCHERGLRLYWIPYFTGAGAGEWRELGMDAMMLQPNYFFDGDGGLNRLRLAAQRAAGHHCGIEIEFDGRALTSPEHRQRLLDYLDAGAHYGWMTGALTGWYEGGGALGMLARDGGDGRALYDAVCDYVKGRHAARNSERLPEFLPPPMPGKHNLALAARGAKVLGAIDDGNPDLAPERMIDGDVSRYSGSSGLSWFHIPGSVVIEFPEMETVARTRMLLYDLDGRHYTYRIETSTDGKDWEPAVDKSAGEWSGWQGDAFTPRAARFLRLTGLSNSTGQHLMQVVEFEVCGPGNGE